MNNAEGFPKRNGLTLIIRPQRREIRVGCRLGLPGGFAGEYRFESAHGLGQVAQQAEVASQVVTDQRAGLRYGTLATQEHITGGADLLLLAQGISPRDPRALLLGVELGGLMREQRHLVPNLLEHGDFQAGWQAVGV